MILALSQCLIALIANIHKGHCWVRDENTDNLLHSVIMMSINNGIQNFGVHSIRKLASTPHINTESPFGMRTHIR